MKLISHRGNLSEIDPSKENHPQQIQTCIDAGYDVEIDLRMKNGIPHLGHDEPQYVIDKEWVKERKNFLWIHVKDYEALNWLMEQVPDATYFCHQSDDFTLVNNGYIWLHNLNVDITEKCVIPLLDLKDLEKFDFKSQPALSRICTDYVIQAKGMLNE